VSYNCHSHLGGREGFGAVVPEPEGELFHADWEREVLAMALAIGASGAWNLDMGRSARETLPDYLTLSYYQIWLQGLERLVVERGLVRADELAAGKMLHPPVAVKRVLHPGEVAGVLARGSPTERTVTTRARFKAGERVRTRAAAVNHHTRLPDYARGKIGRIERVNGAHVFADTHAQGLGEQPEWLYTIVFSGQELWGDESSSDLTVSIDAWEPYLEPLR